MKVKEIIGKIIEKTGLEPFPQEHTCDRLMTGSYEMEVAKVAVTFMATVEVIQKAINMGANFIITHEPTWFTGMDRTEWVKDDPIYLEKKALLEKNEIAVWRFHDHMHMGREDGIYRGFEQKTGWDKYRLSELLPPGGGACYELPETSLKDLARELKQLLEMDVIQLIGEPDMKVRRVSVLVGGGSLGIGIVSSDV